MMFFNKKTQQTLCCDEKCFWIEYWFVFWEERFISELLCSQTILWIAYFTDILSFEKFYKNLHRNLKLIFLFSALFIRFEIGYRQSYITVLRICFFFFWIYELNAVLSTHSNIDFESVIYKLFLGKIYYDLLVV